MYAGINAVREVAEAQTKANLDMWKAMESFAAVMPQPVSVEDMLAFANQTAKFFTQQK
jgi:hypothetical protein